jgi:hypothetical protein
MTKAPTFDAVLATAWRRSTRVGVVDVTFNPDEFLRVLELGGYRIRRYRRARWPVPPKTAAEIYLAATSDTGSVPDRLPPDSATA